MDLVGEAQSSERQPPVDVGGVEVESAGTWLVVGVGFLTLALAFSIRAALGLMMPTWEQELGWSRSTVSGAMSMALIVMAVLAPFAGRLVDRQGPRATLVFGMVTLAIGCFCIAAAESSGFLFFAFGILSAIGFGLVGMHVISTAVGQRAQKNKGLAVGIASSGSTGGQFLIVPLIAVLLTASSWRWAFIWLGVACLVVTVLVIWRLPSRKPDHDAERTSGKSQTSLLQDTLFICRKPAFHALFWSFFLCGYTTTGVIETHFLPYAAFCGFAAIPSATAYGLLSAVNLGGMILAGWLSDRVNRPLLLGSIYLLRGLSFVVLVNIGADIEVLFLFAAFFGLVDYSTVPVTASLIASHIGIRVMGLAFGLISAGHQVGGALGAYLGGYLFDLYARYEWVWWSSLWLAVLAGLMVFLLRDKVPAPEPAPTG